LPLFPSLAPIPLVRFVIPTLYEVLRGQPRGLSPLGARLRACMPTPPRVIDTQYIPPDTPFVLIFNHYESSRVAAWWAPLLIAQEVRGVRTAPPYEVRFVMTEEWWYPGGVGRAVKQPLTHRFFARVAQVYGSVTVPPILEGNLTRGQGAASVRRALELTRGAHPQIVGVAPEGRTGADTKLSEPPPGAGLFLLLLTHETIPLLPVAIFESEHSLTCRFGAPFPLQVERSRDKDERDRAASTLVMQMLARLLPEEMRGSYQV
jgi:1-acyl-sn-glycerol-3-phosphate acyltransferase